MISYLQTRNHLHRYGITAKSIRLTLLFQSNY